MLKKFVLGMVALAVIGCGSSPNEENAKKLKEGMTESEVTTIMGAPTHKEDTDFMGNKVSALLYAGEPQVTVFIVDGKAQSAALDEKTLFGKVTLPGK